MYEELYEKIISYKGMKFGMELNRKIKPNNFKLPKGIEKFFKRIFHGLKSFAGFFWRKMCENKTFARFVYVTLPPKIKKIRDYILSNKKKAGIVGCFTVAVLLILFIVTYINTVDSKFSREGNDDAEFGMVLQNYSTFDHSEKTHIAVKLSWDDGAIDLNGGRAYAKIKATVYPINLENQEIEWNTSDEEIATIDENGFITAANPGNVTITAILKSEGKTSEAKLAVRQPVSGIFLPTSTITLNSGGVGRLLSVRIFPENATNKNVIWKSKNSKVARVDSEGHVTPVSVGMTEVTATTEDGEYVGKCFVNVVNPSVDVQAITLKNEADMKVMVGDNVTAVVTVSPSNAKNKTLKWSSDNEGVALVSQTGRIRGISEGIANITVESVNGKKQTFSVEVVASDSKDPFDLNETVEALEVTGGVTYTTYDITFPRAVNIQMSQNPSPKIWHSGGTVNATEAETAEYMNPNNYYTDAYKYQFLDLSSPNGVSEESLNSYLADKGVMQGMGAVFIEAAQEYNVSEVYLVAHACLESGNGTSQLARGVDVNGTTVYNLFGIGAYDSDPTGNGSQRAYELGWYSVEEAIKGGAKWISENYINNAEGNQNTLYKMRWNPENPGYHEYATDVGWAVKQAVSIEQIFSSFDEAVLSFDVPVYSGQIPPSIEE